MPATFLIEFFSPLAEKFEELLPKLPNALLILLFGFLVIRILQAILGLALQTGRVTRAMQDILQSAASMVLWIGVIALAFQSLGLNQIAIALSGSVAIIGFGVATGANKLVSDILAGVFLAKSRDFKIGQRIRLGEIEGRVYSLDSRKVRILGDDSTLYVIPNTKFDEQTWQVLPDKDKEERRAQK